MYQITYRRKYSNSVSLDEPEIIRDTHGEIRMYDNYKIACRDAEVYNTQNPDYVFYVESNDNTIRS